jgi:hypothetical protein
MKQSTAEKLSIVVDGQPVEPRLIGHRDLGFGQDPGHETETLELQMPAALLVELLGENYRSFVGETREMWTEEEEEDILVKAGYPPFEEVVASQALLEFVLRDCLVFPFLEAVASSPEPTWVINELVGVVRSNELVRVICKAYRRD